MSLPTRPRWSAPARRYDLAHRRQRARVYEQVLIEGIEQDVREIIDVDERVALWDELCLPVHVRSPHGRAAARDCSDMAAQRRHFS